MCKYTLRERANGTDDRFSNACVRSIRPDKRVADVRGVVFSCLLIWMCHGYRKSLENTGLSKRFFAQKSRAAHRPWRVKFHESAWYPISAEMSEKTDEPPLATNLDIEGGKTPAACALSVAQAHIGFSPVTAKPWAEDSGCGRTLYPDPWQPRRSNPWRDPPTNPPGIQIPNAHRRIIAATRAAIAFTPLWPSHAHLAAWCRSRNGA